MATRSAMIKLWRRLTGMIPVACGAFYLLSHDCSSPDALHQKEDPKGQKQRLEEFQVDDYLFNNPKRGAIEAMWVSFVSFDGNEVLSKAQEDVLQLWNSLGGDRSVLDAPRVTLRHDKLSIRFSLPEKIDVMCFIMEIAQMLSKEPSMKYTIKDAEIRVNVGEDGACSILKFECANGASAVGVQLVIPVTREGHAEIEIVKEGSLEDSDLTLVRIILQSSSQTRLNQRRADVDKFVDRWVQSDPHDDPFEEFEAQIRQFLESFPFGDLHSEFEVHSSFGNGQQSQVQEIPTPPSSQTEERDTEQLIQKLETMGAIVYRPNPTERLDWGILSGYEEQKRRIEDGLLLPLMHPDVSDSIAKKTRRHYSSNRPRGVLFEGPPGTGKTTSARLIAVQAAVHLIYLPLESIVSKWYGESEKLLSEAFALADKLGGSILFFDEVETLGSKRNDEMHEASRRLLSVLLREMDGFDLNKKTIVIGATNRKQDVDAALINRFDSTIRFDLPDTRCRAMIFGQYAQQLGESDVQTLAGKTEDMSGRDIRDICESTERSWASKIVRGEAREGALPELPQYLQAVAERRVTIQNQNK